MRDHFDPPWFGIEPQKRHGRHWRGGQCVYYESEPGRRAAAKQLTKDEARRIVSNIAKLPELLGAYDASAASRDK